MREFDFLNYHIFVPKQIIMPRQNYAYYFTSTSPAAAPYAFSAKERDAETGLSYFGARYYSSDLSIWMSVDPMSDKYPSLSPYVYCADNPVRCVDPNGEEVDEPNDPQGTKNKFMRFFNKKIKTPLMRMAEEGASDKELESKATSLADQYQKRLRKEYKRKYPERTKWDHSLTVEVKLFDEIEDKITVESRPDNKEMKVCGEIPIGSAVYAAEVDFAPYGVENYATFIAANVVETGWVNSPDGNSFHYELNLDGANTISYCIQNKLTDKRQDNWSFSVILHSRKYLTFCEIVVQ